MMLPQELYDLLWSKLDPKIISVEYSRVIMPLSALLEGAFFNLYIKTGNSYSSHISFFKNHECLSFRSWSEFFCRQCYDDFRGSARN